jgi:hypothetical protein
LKSKSPFRTIDFPGFVWQVGFMENTRSKIFVNRLSMNAMCAPNYSAFTPPSARKGGRAANCFANRLISRAGMCRIAAAFLFLFLAAGLAPVIYAQTNGRQVVLEAMQQRPGDSWPRSSGHVILAYPGSRETGKAYLEPGGNFSPCINSFGISFWIYDEEGKLQTTSEKITIDQIRQQWIWPALNLPPAILTDTLYYKALWSLASPGQGRLALSIPTNSTSTVQILVRSPGPAGGPLQTIEWNGKTLRLNSRWILTFDPAPTAVYTGHEGEADWTTSTASERQWRNADGWGFARIVIPKGHEFKVAIFDPSPGFQVTLPYSMIKSAVDVRLPDAQFAACMNAQAAQLLMGITGSEIRPGDPMQYPISSLREGASILVALARAGQINLASQLARPFADRDFFGGRGPEADAPGLALWALMEIAGRVNQNSFDASLQTHVIRKAQLIHEMLAATKPIRKTVTPPVDPQYAKDPQLSLLCDPARNGLIMGKAGGTRPLLYINAANSGGLTAAAEFMDRRGAGIYGLQWRIDAAQMRESWFNALKSPNASDEWTWVNGLWPSWAAGPHRDDFAAALQMQTPGLGFDAQPSADVTAHPHVLLAKAHQWLYLNKPDTTWETLKWLWKNQSSPGLYTWGDGSGESPNQHQWERVRGWVTPSQSTPHYWTAAEMFLLQCDMLVCVDESTPNPVLIVGAGIPSYWMDRPMSVRGLSTRFGAVSWNWSNGRMNVIVYGRRLPVRLGPAFKSNAFLKVDYANL